MKYQEILDCLLVERKGKNTDLGPLVGHIKKFFQDDLRHADAGDTFTYKKKGKVFVVSKNEQIVSRFDDLCSRDAELRARWEEFRGMGA